jgi:hypothetical protein
MSASALVGFILVPLIAGLLIREWLSFPKKIAREVSKSVTAELSSNFIEINTNILEHLRTYFLDHHIEELGKKNRPGSRDRSRGE